MSMTAAFEQELSRSRLVAIVTAAQLSMEVPDDQRDRAAELAGDVSDPDVSDRKAREALDSLRALAVEVPQT